MMNKTLPVLTVNLNGLVALMGPKVEGNKLTYAVELKPLDDWRGSTKLIWDIYSEETGEVVYHGEDFRNLQDGDMIHVALTVDVNFFGARYAP